MADASSAKRHSIDEIFCCACHRDDAHQEKFQHGGVHVKTSGDDCSAILSWEFCFDDCLVLGPGASTCWKVSKSYPCDALSDKMRPPVAVRFRLIFSNGQASGIVRHRHECLRVQSQKKRRNHNEKTNIQPIRKGDDCSCVGGNERKRCDRHKPSLGKEFNQIHTGRLQDHRSHHFDSPMKGLAAFLWRVPHMVIAPKKSRREKE